MLEKRTFPHKKFREVQAAFLLMLTEISNKWNGTWIVKIKQVKLQSSYSKFCFGVDVLSV